MKSIPSLNSLTKTRSRRRSRTKSIDAIRSHQSNTTREDIHDRTFSNDLLSEQRIPKNLRPLSLETSAEIFPSSIDLVDGYRKLLLGHPNLTEFSTHPSDHGNPGGGIIKNDHSSVAESEPGDFSTGMHVALGRLDGTFEAVVTCFTCSKEVLGVDEKTSGSGSMVTGHADGTIIFYSVFPGGSLEEKGLEKLDEGIEENQEESKIMSSDICSDSFEIKCTSIALGNPGRIQQLKFVHVPSNTTQGEPQWVVLSVASNGEISKWDSRDGRCLATFLPLEGVDSCHIDGTYVVRNKGTDYVLCTGPGIFLILGLADLGLVSDLSSEMVYTSALPIPLGSSESDQLPVLFMGLDWGELTLGNVKLPADRKIVLRCTLSLGMEVIDWQVNDYAQNSEHQQVLLISSASFVVIQIEHSRTMRQLTQRVPPPSADDMWTNGFFASDTQLVVITKSGGVFHYCWDAAGGLIMAGESSSNEAPYQTAGRFNSILSCGSELHLVGLFPGSMKLVGGRICPPTISPDNSLSNKWQQNLSRPGESSDSCVSALTPITLESEQGSRPWVAKGFQDGAIRVVPLTQLFDGLETDASHVLVSHVHVVTCLYQPCGVGSKQLLISGDASGSVRLWELSSWVRLALFQGHSQPVHMFFQFPALSLDQQLVFGLGRDASISVFCLKRMACLGLIPGHRAKVHQMLYYPESVLEVVYADGHRTQWVLNPKGIRIATEETTSLVACGVRLDNSRASVKADIACYPIWDMHHSFPVIQVFDINARTLLRSMTSFMDPTVKLLPQVKSINQEKKVIVVPEASHSSEISLQLAKHVLYALLTKYADVSNILGDALTNKLLVGIRGGGSKISFMLQSSICKRNQTCVWTVSPYATASRLLPSAVLAKAANSYDGDESKAIAVLANYGCILPEIVGEAFQFPCLGYLAKFWQDPTSDVQSATRSLFLSLFGQLGFTHQCQIVDHWMQLLPRTLPVDLVQVQHAGLAVVVLGIVIAHYPDLIPDNAVRARIARSLEWLLSNHARPSFRIPAIQIVSLGFQQLEAHVDGVWILRCLYNAYHEQSRHLRMTSQQAALQITLANSPLFITSLGLARGARQLSAIMQLISFMVQTAQALLQPYMPRIIEFIVKSLDPRDTEQRQALIAPSTQCLHDLVTAYSVVDFHPGTQRLAVGVMEGAAIVYDLYTSTRCLVVEGYHSPVSAVALSPDGKFLATFSKQESLLKIWNSSGGLFNMLAKTLRGHSPAPVPASRSKSPLSVTPSSFLSPHSQAGNVAAASAPVSGSSSPRPLPQESISNANSPSSKSPLSFFSSSPTPYRTFNTSLGDQNSDSDIVDLRFTADRSLHLMANDISLVFNI